MTDGDPRKRKDARPCKKDEIASVKESQRVKRKTASGLNGALETIPSRCTQALSGRKKQRDRRDELRARDM